MSQAPTGDVDAEAARALLRRLLEALWDPAPALLSDTDADALLVVARRHRLTPALAGLARAALPPKLAEACLKDRLGTVARNLLFGRIAAECARAFAEAGIPTVVLKGLAYEATIYPQAGLRPTSDVDFLVPDGQRRRAFAVLDRLGFEPRAAAPGFDEPDYHEVAWTRDGFEIDLHLALAPLVRCNIDYEEVWAEVREAVVAEVPVRVLHPAHAAVFHALHMAIDHFDVPGLYLLDFSRLAPGTSEVAAAEAVARRWRCHHPFATTCALTAAFLPRWQGGTRPTASAVPWFAGGIVEGYGRGGGLPRARQLVRKMTHFDRAGDALRYVLVQGRRNGRELIERRFRRRSARERLALDADG